MVGTGVYVDDIQAQAARLRVAIISVTGMILAAVMLLAVFLIASIMRPMKALMSYAEKVTQGDLDADISGKFPAETGRLKHVITTMVGRLKQTIRELETKSREAEEAADEALCAKEALGDREKQLRAITDSARDAVIMMDSTGTISFWNPAAETIFGYPGEEALGQNLHYLIAPERYHEAYAKASPQFQRFGTGKAIGDTVELTALRKDGQEIPISLSLSALSLDDKRHAVGIVRDITKPKQAEEALIQAKEQAEAANQAKSEFLANMSHELRTPLNGIMGIMQLLQTSRLDAEQQRWITMAIKSSDRLARLLTDILDISRIEAGRMELFDEEFNPQELCDSVCELFIATSREKDVALECAIDASMPLKLIGDAARVRQVLFNLVGNAQKFTEKGTVTVEMVPLSSHRKGVARVLFSVSDTGIGIPDDRLGDLFQPFVQVDGSYTRSYQGAGLGLSIVKRLVDLMGGNISVESEVDKGTTVHVLLSFKLPQGGNHCR